MSALWDSQQHELELQRRILWLGRWMQTSRPRWADESFKADIKCVINNNLHVQPNTLCSTASSLLAGDSKCVSSHVLCYRGSWPQGEGPRCGFWGTFVFFSLCSEDEARLCWCQTSALTCSGDLKPFPDAFCAHAVVPEMCGLNKQRVSKCTQ